MSNSPISIETATLILKRSKWSQVRLISFDIDLDEVPFATLKPLQLGTYEISCKKHVLQITHLSFKSEVFEFVATPGSITIFEISGHPYSLGDLLTKSQPNALWDPNWLRVKASTSRIR
jgi:hypothetical protein